MEKKTMEKLQKKFEVLEKQMAMLNMKVNGLITILEMMVMDTIKDLKAQKKALKKKRG